MGENWKLRGTENNIATQAWQIRGTVSSINNEITPELQKTLDSLLERVSKLNLQEDNILKGTLEIINSIADVRNQGNLNINYQESLNNISQEINNIIEKRRYILYIGKRIGNIDINYSTWTPTSAQKKEISALNTRILEASERYPDDPTFISILSRLKLRLDKLFTV